MEHGTHEAHGTDGVPGDDELLATGWLDACLEHRGIHADGPCDDCGWLAADHTAELAVVIEVGRVSAAPLRRAS